MSNPKAVAVGAAVVVAAILVWVTGHALLTAAHESTRPLSVTLMSGSQVYHSGSGYQTDNNFTHGATVCIGQYGSSPPASQCAKTNDQGVAEVATDGMVPGSYGVIVFCPGQQQAYWQRNRTAPLEVTIPERGDPAPVTVTDFNCYGQ